MSYAIDQMMRAAEDADGTIDTLREELAAAEADRDAQRARAEAAEAEVARLRADRDRLDLAAHSLTLACDAARADAAALRAIADAADELVSCDARAEVESYGETAPGARAAAQVAAEAAYGALARAVEARREAGRSSPTVTP